MTKPRTSPDFVPSLVTDVKQLRQPCERISVKKGMELASELRNTIERYNKRVKNAGGQLHRFSMPLSGVGLAAPQIGVQSKVCIIHIPGEFMVLINPRITSWSDSKFQYEEGCLSLPGRTGYTNRYAWVSVECDNWPSNRVFGCSKSIDNPELQLNVCIQHEIAHLSGKLMFDFESDEYPTPDQWDEWVV